MKVSLKKTKTIFFKGKNPMRSKDRDKRRNCGARECLLIFSMNLSYKGEVDIKNKLYKFIKLRGFLNRTMPVTDSSKVRVIITIM